MAKKQTRRSISVSRTTYERLKSFCETNGISMSQFVETRVGDFLTTDGSPMVVATPVAPRPTAPALARPLASPPRASFGAPPPVRPMPLAPRPVAAPAPITSVAARYAIDPPPPIIKKAEQPAPKPPVMPKPDQIFTF